MIRDIRISIEVRAIEVSRSPLGGPGYGPDRAWVQEFLVAPIGDALGIDVNTIVERVVNRALAMTRDSDETP